jgi:NTP pyrophosphatase (non-canonical NTP hydrolase)
MTTDEYEKLAMRTEADQGKILIRLASLGPDAMRLDNAARGLAGDAGEVSTAVMKFIEYGRDLDRTNLIEEVGDCLWRLAQVCKAAGFTLQDAMEANIRKLSVRYPEKYSDTLSANRNPEAERRAVEERLKPPVLSDPNHVGIPDDPGTYTDNFFKGHVSGEACDRPPDGWYCTRPKGHEGPCAAHPQNHSEWIPEKGSGQSLVVNAETENRVKMGPVIEQDGHGFGHVGYKPSPPFCSNGGGAHDWELVQTEEGSGYKCRGCGVIGPVN